MSNERVNISKVTSPLKPCDIKLSVSVHFASQQTHPPQPPRIAWNDNVNQTSTRNNITPRRIKDLSCRQRCSYCFPGFVAGFLLAGLVFGIVIVSLFTSEKTTTKFSYHQTYASSTVKLVKSADVTLATSTSTISTTISTNCENWSWEKNGVTIAGITGISDSTSDKLNEPWNIFVDSKSNILYIADSQNHRVQQWLPWATSGITIAGTGVPGSTSTLLNTPKDVFLDSFENIYVADAGNQRIQFFPKDSKVASTVSLNWSCASIGAVQVVNESIYACDYNRSSILNNGSEVASNQWTNNTGDLLSLPQGFAVDTTMVIGTIYVANSNKHTIVKWPVKASTGITVAGVYGIAGNTSNLLAYPTSIKLDQYANIFVVDNNNHRIQLFCQYPIANSTGRTIVGTGKSGQTADTLNYPIGIALDASLNLYVSDTGNHRIQKFRRLL